MCGQKAKAMSRLLDRVPLSIAWLLPHPVKLLGLSGTLCRLSMYISWRWFGRSPKDFRSQVCIYTHACTYTHALTLTCIPPYHTSQSRMLPPEGSLCYFQPFHCCVGLLMVMCRVENPGAEDFVTSLFYTTVQLPNHNIETSY